MFMTSTMEGLLLGLTKACFLEDQIEIPNRTKIIDTPLILKI